MDGSRFLLKLSFFIADPPSCRSRGQILYSVSLNSSVELECDMEANPATDMVFRWSGNTSVLTRRMDNMASSRILYTPSLETHYGSLYCHADTTIGTGAPCIYIILPPGLSSSSSHKPDCSPVNITHTSFEVEQLISIAMYNAV